MAAVLFLLLLLLAGASMAEKDRDACTPSFDMAVQGLYEENLVRDNIFNGTTENKKAAQDFVNHRARSSIIPKWERLKRSALRYDPKEYYFDPYAADRYRRPIYGKGPVYRPRRKKFPRLFGPWPLGFTFRDPIRPFPDNTLFLGSGSILIPFAPFGSFQFLIPFGFFLNYIIERLNGVEDGRSGRHGRSLEDDQLDFFRWFDDYLTNTFAVDGKTCVQRAICDISENPLRGRSLMGEVVHMVLEPRRGAAKILDDYVEADLHGHRHGGCGAKYGRCPFSLASVIDKIRVKRT